MSLIKNDIIYLTLVKYLHINGNPATRHLGNIPIVNLAMHLKCISDIYIYFIKIKINKWNKNFLLI